MVKQVSTQEESLESVVFDGASQPVPPAEQTPSADSSTAAALLKFVGTWVGDDLEERLAEVYATRSEAEL